MKIVELDLTGCKYWDELHERIKVALDFPDYYGKNLSAFWDCINRDCDVNFVTIKGVENIADDLKPTVKSILEMFEKNKKSWENTECPFDYEIV